MNIKFAGASMFCNKLTYKMNQWDIDDYSIFIFYAVSFEEMALNALMVILLFDIISIYCSYNAPNSKCIAIGKVMQNGIKAIAIKSIKIVRS